MAQRQQAGSDLDLTPPPRIEVDSGLFTIHAAPLTTQLASVVQQSGVRVSQVQVRKTAIIRWRGWTSIRNATSATQYATSHPVPAQGFHGRGR